MSPGSIILFKSELIDMHKDTITILEKVRRHSVSRKNSYVGFILAKSIKFNLEPVYFDQCYHSYN